VEEARTDGDFTHYAWIATRDLASQDKVRAAVLADRDQRSKEEQESIIQLFTSLTDPDAVRTELNRSCSHRRPLFLGLHGTTLRYFPIFQLSKNGARARDVVALVSRKNASFESSST
jgi:hypothetical protein